MVHPGDVAARRVEAAEIGIEPILVGPGQEDAEVARAHNLQIGKFQVSTPGTAKCRSQALEPIRKSKASC